MNKNLTKEDVLNILRKEEDKRRREAKRREKEILALMKEQNLDYRGKLWGEISFTAIAARKNGGNGANPTDVEAEICSDINMEEFFASKVDPKPLRFFLLSEAWDIAKKTISRQWGKRGITLFAKWLDGTVAEICKENNLPAMQTMELIKSMVLACRREAGRRPYFPFPEEEAEVRQFCRRINTAASVKRRMVGEAKPADPKNRIYLSSEEMALGVDWLKEVIQSKYKVKISRSTAWRAKKTGWFMRPGYKRQAGKKVFLAEEEKQWRCRDIMEKYGVSHSTAKKAKERGWFITGTHNQHNSNLTEPTVTVRKAVKKKLFPSMVLPEILTEVAGRKIKDLTVKEITEILGYSLKRARNIKKRGYINTSRMYNSKREDLRSRIAKVEKEGWPRLS